MHVLRKPNRPTIHSNFLSARIRPAEVGQHFRHVLNVDRLRSTAEDPVQAMIDFLHVLLAQQHMKEVMIAKHHQQVVDAAGSDPQK